MFKGTICFTVTLTCRRWRRKLKEQKKGRGGEFSNNVLIKKKKEVRTGHHLDPQHHPQKKGRRGGEFSDNVFTRKKKKARTGNHLDPPTPTPLFLSLRDTHHTFPTKRLPSILNS